MHFGEMKGIFQVAFLSLILAFLSAYCQEAPENDGVEFPPMPLSVPESVLADQIAHFYAGVILDSEGHFQEAVGQYEAVLATDPGKGEAVVALARDYLLLGKAEKALETLEQGLKADPGNVAIAGDLVRFYGRREKTNDVVRVIETVLAADPGNAEFLAVRIELDLAMAAAKLKTGDRRGAVKCLARLESRAKDDKTAARVFNMYVLAGRQDRALRFARRLPEEVMASRVFNYTAGLLLVAREQYNAALPFFFAVENGAAGSDEKLDAAFYFYYGMVSERTGRFEDAERYFEKCIGMEPSFAEALNYLAYMWAERSVKLDRALEYVNTALRADPESGAYMDTRGWIYFKQGKNSEALKDVGRARVLSPDEPEIFDHLGDILLASGELEKAVAEWKKAFVMDPSNKKLAQKLASHGVKLAPLRRDARLAAVKPADRKGEPCPHEEETGALPVGGEE